MKRILIVMTTIAFVIIAIGCSKDHSAPTFGTYDTPKPSNVAVSYNSDDQTADVTWTMANSTDVVGYQLSISDSSLFDLGHIYNEPTGQATSQTIKINDTSKTYYIKVGAIFNNDTLNNFYGPLSDDAAVLEIESE